MQFLAGITWRNAAKVDVGESPPAASGYPMFDKVRQSCLKN